MTEDAFECSHLIEHCVHSETLAEGQFLRVLRDTVRLANGGTVTREYVAHPGAVVVVPLVEDGRVLLERQFRYPVGQVMLEFPAGKLDANEAPLACGQRELREETGYTAREWAHAGTMHLAIGYSTEVLHIYFARGLVSGPRDLDDGETLDVFPMHPEQVLEWCRDGRITDAKILACSLWLQNVGTGAWPLVWQNAVAPGA